MRSITVWMTFSLALILSILTLTGAWQADSFILGATHPLLGMDHILVMVAVGLWAVLLGKRAIWVLPMTFLAVMILGFVVASVGFRASLVEPVISSSIIVLGLLVALSTRAPLWLGALLTGLFAFFHGHAHGMEVATANLASYAVGFTLATSTLHAIGIAIGLFASGSIKQVAVRAIGGLMVLVGTVLMVI